MADLLSTIFQYSDSIRLDRTKQERWTTESQFRDYALIDSLGNRSRVLKVTIHNPFGARTDWYQPMTRVRLLEDYGVTAFLGRVISIEQNYQTQTAVITCRDYLDDIADRTVEAADTNGVLTAATRSFIIDQLLDSDTYKPTIGSDLDRTLLRRLKMDSSPYSESLSRSYSQRGNYQTITGSGNTAVASNYQFRGVKTGLEALSELATEDPQQDLMAFYYHPSPTNVSNANHTNNPQQYPRAYWTDLTRNIVDGNTHFVSPQVAHDSTTPETADILYFGSNSKFDGLRYSFLTRGANLAQGAYADSLQWQFWNGTAWTNFTPTADAKFAVDSGKTYGTVYWTISNLTDWGKRDLGTTPDMHTANDAALGWAAPWASSGTTLPEDVDSTSISKIDHGDDRRTTNRYWVRVYARTGSITVAKLATVEFYTKPNLFHDFRCEDPQYFSEVWRYTHSTAGSGWTAGRDGVGGTWTALNTTGLNAGTGNPLLWNANENSVPFVNGTVDTWYFGSEYPFNGVQFHALQENIPDYSNVKFVWQFYDPYFATAQSEPWQTISGLTISGNTVANPTVITTERHHLDTGDSVTISGSNSTPSINGTHTVTRISATTFSIAVNVTTAGTAGHVVCNNRITASEAMSGTGDAAWMRDLSSQSLSQEFYLDIRWDTDNFYSSTANTFTNDIDATEFDKFQMLDEYPYSSRVSGRSTNMMKKVSSVGTNSISAANPTVITSADGAGGTTANHNLTTGDKVFLRGTNSTPSVDGIHTITSVSANTFSIPVNVTSSGNTGTATGFVAPPSSRVLYWVRCFITSGTPTTRAIIRDVKTAPVGLLKYFARGKEPWVYNANTTVQGTTATRDIQYCYRYDTSASAGSKFTDYSQEISSSTSGTSLRITGNTIANPTVVTTDGPSLTISSNTAVTTTVVTTSTAHGLATDDTVVITGSNSTPSLNGTYAVTVLSTTTFSVPVRITSAGSAGTVVPTIPHGLSTGHKVVITNSNSTPSLNGTHTVTVLSTTTFSVAVNVTSAGTAGTVVPEKVYGMDNGQIGDAVYFGMDEPFTAIRLNVSDVLSSSSTGQSGVIYEYFLGGSTDNWTTIANFDETGDFTTSGTNEITFDKPAFWKTCQPGIKEANATDQSFGKTAYYIRARISATTGSPATSAAKFIQGWVGPNLWNTQMEVGTASGISATGHSDPKTYGVTLTESEFISRQNISIADYAVNEQPIAFINKVSVRGRSGSYGVAQDDTSIDAYGLVKERTIDDSTLTNSLQCEARAQAILEQLKPENNAFFRECKILTHYPPIYSHLSRPQLVRAGDRVNVNIPNINISDETWIVYSINCSYSEHNSWGCEFTLFRDMTSIFEPGTSERRLLRDLATRTRETANAVFQPLDKAVVSGLDFLPEGPGRNVGREEYGPVGTGWGIYPTGSGTLGNYTGEFRWTKKLYANHNTKETLGTDLMRIEHTGINPEEDGVAQGGAGLGFIARDKRGNGTPDFHPGTDEATLYLRNSGTATEGSGLYLAHRDIFNSGATYDEWATDTPKINAEVMTGFTGFVSHVDLDANGRFTINLPALDSAPLVFATICGHEGLSGTPGNATNAACNVYRWTTASSKYTAVQMQVINYPNDVWTSGGSYNITAISAANPTVITTTASMPNGRAVFIGQTNSTPAIDGIYHLSNKAGSNPYTYTATSINTSVFPHNVTSAGTSGLIMSMGHGHEVDQAYNYDYSDNDPAIGVMYMVVFNSGKNTTGLNSHFSQNHVDHG